MNNKKYVSWITAAGLVASLAIAGSAFAATAPQAWSGGSGGMHRGGGAPGVFGTVSAVNGTTLTVTAKARPTAANANAAAVASATVYTVDASNAKVYKGSSTSTVSVSNIATGDTVMVAGTVSGSNITATSIRDGVGGTMGRVNRGASSTTPRTMPTTAIQGNGEPVIGGAVTAIDGSTLTVTNASNVTYTINAVNSTIIKNGTSTTIANVAVGDNLIVQGTVSGTSVTASSVIDQGVKSGNTSSSGVSASSGSHGGGFGFGGVFSAIGGFFKHLFGF